VGSQARSQFADEAAIELIRRRRKTSARQSAVSPGVKYANRTMTVPTIPSDASNATKIRKRVNIFGLDEETRG
jgi:hypothetical protein